MNIAKVRSDILRGISIYDMNLRVADYGRVSTDKDDQLNSLENQINFFNDLIGSVKSWVHVNSYSDEGISGTQVFKREQFLKMIEDAKSGKIDLIITKEVSRFARNTIDSIKYTQELLNYGVAVLFLSDNINTISLDSEFRLTLMASMAQDEVRKLSERVKFGIKRSIKDGKLGGSSIYGYNKKNGRLIINEKEALGVRNLFELYSTGEYGFGKISSILASGGYYTRRGKCFSSATLKKMITNPRYKGYYTANMSEVEDYKTHKKKIKPKSEWIVYKDISGNVPAIVSEELWNLVNQIYEDRRSKKAKNILNRDKCLENKLYTSKLICLDHGKNFVRCASGKRVNNPIWRCSEYLRYGLKGCMSPLIYEKHLNLIFAKVISSIVYNEGDLVSKIISDYKNIIKEDNLEDSQIILQIEKLNKVMDRLLDMLLENIILEDEYKIKRGKLINEIDRLNGRLDSNNGKGLELENINEIEKFIKKKLNINRNIYDFFNLFIDKVYVSKVNNDRNKIKLEIVFRFKQDNVIVDYDRNNFDIRKILEGDYFF